MTSKKPTTIGELRSSGYHVYNVREEVRRTTRKGIIINTFMLDRNYYLKEFVNQIASMNKGRVFYTTPDRLGQYILVDYVAQKRKRISGA